MKEQGITIYATDYAREKHGGKTKGKKIRKQKCPACDLEKFKNNIENVKDNKVGD